ncbi:hypothetical protein CHLRE_12g508643v5 [Chlamydomonas reinhardtii]|uniref:Uncharacterized protein n=1 Tax=Chlamydomonas reinhardtii TaxID=3055 RepID=A0A2K3D2Q2_CHLRE|nr:uncharacterized protein CHLRE_12g508643v5 [Chlamydomonas reinhardtii]PNW74816.1 hypothetical protein CHLRE_12g508643v5 [Chlamydomonas reinhardtii]
MEPEAPRSGAVQCPPVSLLAAHGGGRRVPRPGLCTAATFLLRVRRGRTAPCVAIRQLKAATPHAPWPCGWVEPATGWAVCRPCPAQAGLTAGPRPSPAVQLRS